MGEREGRKKVFTRNGKIFYGFKLFGILVNEAKFNFFYVSNKLKIEIGVCFIGEGIKGRLFVFSMKCSRGEKKI